MSTPKAPQVPSRQTKKNHDWISLWIMFSIIWDNFGVNVEPFLVPNIARGPPCRPQRRPRYRPARPRRTMIGSVFGSCFRSSGTILASLWNHVWCPKSPEEPFLVPKIARGPPCRPLRRPRHHPMGPGTSQEHPYGSQSGPRGAPRVPNGSKWSPKGGQKMPKKGSQK